MPIYAYRCADCGHEKDVLRKLSDAPLTQCPACGKDTFAKQVTAAGFQLKGSGWYVTDFRGGNSGAGALGASASKSDDASATSGNSTASDSASTPGASSSDAGKSASTPAAPSSGSSGSSATSGSA